MIDGIVFSEERRKELEKSIENFLPAIQAENPQNKSFNYLPPENALKTVTENFIKNTPKDSANYDNSIIEKIIHNLLKETLSQLERYVPYNDEKYTNIKKEIFSICEDYLITKVNTNAKRFAEAANSENFLDTVLSQFQNESEKIALSQALAGIFGYFQDSKRVMKQKQKSVDMEDYEHSKFIPYCKYFVTNDKHLLKRLQASTAILKIQTEILSFEDFISEIKRW